nr:hypothetical protein [Tanacetum cinerariifolium]
IAIDAYRLEIASDSQQATLAASYMAGYRVAALLATAGALYFAEGFGSTGFAYKHSAWTGTYVLFGLLMLPALITTLIMREPAVPDVHSVVQHRFRQRAVRRHHLEKPADGRPCLLARDPLHAADRRLPVVHGPSGAGTCPDDDTGRCCVRRTGHCPLWHPAHPVHWWRDVGGHQPAVPDAGRHGPEPEDADRHDLAGQLQLRPCDVGIRGLPVEPDQPQVLGHAVRAAELDHAAVAALDRRVFRGDGGEARLPQLLPGDRADGRTDPVHDRHPLGAGGTQGKARRGPEAR